MRNRQMSHLRNGKCWRCGCDVPLTHGYCLPCGYYADGYDSGANHCDEFDGTTERDALVWRDETGDETWESYSADFDLADCNAAGMTMNDAQLRFLSGMYDGLRCAARHNDETRRKNCEHPHTHIVVAGNIWKDRLKCSDCGKIL